MEVYLSVAQEKEVKYAILAQATYLLFSTPGLEQSVFGGGSSTVSTGSTGGSRAGAAAAAGRRWSSLAPCPSASQGNPAALVGPIGLVGGGCCARPRWSGSGGPDVCGPCSVVSFYFLTCLLEHF